MSRSDFPSLANPYSRGSRGTPAKGTVGGSMSRQKSLSSSPSAAQSSFKGRRDAITKHTGKNTTCLKNLLFEFLFICSHHMLILQKPWTSEIGVRVSLFGWLGQRVSFSCSDKTHLSLFILIDSLLFCIVLLVAFISNSFFLFPSFFLYKVVSQLTDGWVD